MNIIIGILIVTLVLSYGFLLIYFTYRTNKVYKLRKLILDLSVAYWDEQIEKYDRFDGFTQYDELPSYNKMTYSFKPLKLKNYLSEKSLKN